MFHNLSSDGVGSRLEILAGIPPGIGSEPEPNADIDGHVFDGPGVDPRTAEIGVEAWSAPILVTDSKENSE